MSRHVMSRGLVFFHGGGVARRGHSDSDRYSMCGVNAVKGHNLLLYKHIVSLM